MSDKSTHFAIFAIKHMNRFWKVPFPSVGLWYPDYNIYIILVDFNPRKYCITVPSNSAASILQKFGFIFFIQLTGILVILAMYISYFLLGPWCVRQGFILDCKLVQSWNSQWFPAPFSKVITTALQKRVQHEIVSGNKWRKGIEGTLKLSLARSHAFAFWEVSSI